MIHHNSTPHILYKLRHVKETSGYLRKWLY